MKRLVALTAALCLVASPALAGIAKIVGSGTGGTIGKFVGAASMTFSPSAAVPAGSVIVIAVASFTNSNTIACTDDATGGSNTYTSIASVQGVTNTQTTMLYGQIARALTTSNIVTCTQSSGNANNLLYALGFSGALASPFDAVITGFNASAVTSVGPLPSLGPLACNTTAGEVVVAMFVSKNSLTLTTESTGFTTIVTDNGANEAMNLAIDIVNSNASLTYSPTLTQSPATGWSGAAAGFKAATCSGAARKSTLSLLGVGE